MSGVIVGTRLEQLQTLRNRLDHEIAAEQRRLALAPTVRPIHHATLPAPRPAPVGGLPATSVIRAWAIDNGYISEHQRHGRLPAHVFEIYREQVLS